MKPFQKMNDNAGNEVCLFPLPVMNITQLSSPDSFSHCCGHPFDAVGQTKKANVYAPVTMELVRNYSDGNGRLWKSVKKVLTPSGLSYISIYFLHDYNPPFSTIGSIVNQGSIIAHTGTTGFVTGDHTHIDQTLRDDSFLINYGVTCSGGNECWALSKSISPNLVFFMNDTEIINDKGLTFSKYDGKISRNKFKFYYYLRGKNKYM